MNRETRARIELAKYALVAGNTSRVPVPVEIIGRWLDYIAGRDNHEPCALCGDRQLEDCHWACLEGEETDGPNDAVQDV